MGTHHRHHHQSGPVEPPQNRARVGYHPARSVTGRPWPVSGCRWLPQSVAVVRAVGFGFEHGARRACALSGRRWASRASWVGALAMEGAAGRAKAQVTGTCASWTQREWGVGRTGASCGRRGEERGGTRRLGRPLALYTLPWAVPIFPHLPASCQNGPKQKTLLRYSVHCAHSLRARPADETLLVPCLLDHTGTGQWVRSIGGELVMG